MQLDCQNLNFTYPGSKTVVIKDLSFSMKHPGFNAVFGPSGVGKTSLAKILAGMVTAVDGDLTFKQIDTILYSYNRERLPGWSSTGKHLDRVIQPEKQALKEQLVEIFELADVLDSRFSKLSMGQQNRINLVRYLLQDFDLLIMDESLANVDEKLREKILLAIKTLFRDKMFLYISHNLMEVSTFCKQILVFAKASEKKSCCVVTGQNRMQNSHLDRKKLDATLLEIMNAF